MQLDDCQESHPQVLCSFDKGYKFLSFSHCALITDLRAWNKFFFVWVDEVLTVAAISIEAGVSIGAEVLTVAGVLNVAGLPFQFS